MNKQIKLNSIKEELSKWGKFIVFVIIAIAIIFVILLGLVLIAGFLKSLLGL